MVVLNNSSCLHAHLVGTSLQIGPPNPYIHQTLRGCNTPLSRFLSFPFFDCLYLVFLSICHCPFFLCSFRLSLHSMNVSPRSLQNTPPSPIMKATSSAKARHPPSFRLGDPSQGQKVFFFRKELGAEVPARWNMEKPVLIVLENHRLTVNLYQVLPSPFL